MAYKCTWPVPVRVCYFVSLIIRLSIGILMLFFAALLNTTKQTLLTLEATNYVEQSTFTPELYLFIYGIGLTGLSINGYYIYVLHEYGNWEVNTWVNQGLVTTGLIGMNIVLLNLLPKYYLDSARLIKVGGRAAQAIDNFNQALVYNIILIGLLFLPLFALLAVVGIGLANLLNPHK